MKKSFQKKASASTASKLSSNKNYLWGPVLFALRRVITLFLANGTGPPLCCDTLKNR
jgi:hypothetical protein